MVRSRYWREPFVQRDPGAADVTQLPQRGIQRARIGHLFKHAAGSGGDRGQTPDPDIDTHPRIRQPDPGLLGALHQSPKPTPTPTAKATNSRKGTPRKRY